MKNKNTISFYNELHSQLDIFRQQMVDTRASSFRNEFDHYNKRVTHNGNKQRDFECVYQQHPDTRYSYRESIPMFVRECFDFSDKIFDDSDTRYYQNVTAKNEIDRERIIVDAAIKSVDHIIEFYKSRVKEKLDEVDSAAKIKSLKLENFYVDGYYPVSEMLVANSNGGSATVRTTVEESSNKGTWYTRFPTRFHNCVGKDGNKVARPSWDRYIDAIVDDVEAYRAAKAITRHNTTVVNAIKREEDKIIQYEKMIVIYTKRLEESPEDKWNKHSISAEKRKIKKCSLRKEELKKELK